MAGHPQHKGSLQLERAFEPVRVRREAEGSSYEEVIAKSTAGLQRPQPAIVEAVQLEQLRRSS